MLIAEIRNLLILIFHHAFNFLDPGALVILDILESLVLLIDPLKLYRLKLFSLIPKVRLKRQEFLFLLNPHCRHFVAHPQIIFHSIIGRRTHN